MPEFEPILAHAVPLMLVVLRLSGLFVLSPVLGSRAIPGRFRALLAVALGAAVYAGLPPAAAAPAADVFILLPLAVSELLIGAAMGFIASIPIASLDMAGYLMGHQMGLGLARVYNPEAGGDADVLGQMLMFIGLAAFIAMGGLEAMYLALVSTFERVPAGTFAVDRLPLEAMVGVLSSGFELAVRVAAPVTCIVLLLLIALGFVMKTMPQVNVMSIGFTIKIMGGIAALTASLAAVHHAAHDEIARVGRLVLDWGGAIREGGRGAHGRGTGRTHRAADGAPPL